jgi:hypothetical protein
MSKPRSLTAVLPVLFLAAFVAGCATTEKIMKADPAADSGFLEEPERMEAHRERAPFNRAWVDPAHAPISSHYQSIQVAPVNTEHVLASSTWAKTNVRQFKIEEDLADIATEFRTKVIDAFATSDDNRFAIVDSANDDTMVLELAVTELVPGKAFLGAVGLAAWAAPAPIGVPAGIAASFAQAGWMAIEGRVRDARTGEVVAMFADREQSKTRVVDVQAVTWYGHAHESMNDWSQQLVRLANTPKDVEVEDSSWFRLRPW